MPRVTRPSLAKFQQRDMPTSSPRPIAPRPPARLSPPWRVGVDVGGTFTDLVLIDAEGTLHVAKVPSTPSDPSLGVLAAVEAAAMQAGLTAREPARELLALRPRFHGRHQCRRRAPRCSDWAHRHARLSRQPRDPAWHPSQRLGPSPAISAACSCHATCAFPSAAGSTVMAPRSSRWCWRTSTRRWTSSGGRASRPSPSASTTAS